MSRTYLALFGVGFLLLGTEKALATCNQTSTSISQADRDLWNIHGCWKDFYLWQSKAYGMRASDWRSRGWNNACSLRFEFPKHWNAAYLVTYGLMDNNDESFHGTTDYRQTAEAAGSSFHSSLYHTVTDDLDVFGRFKWKPFGPNEVQTSCLLYDATISQNANPASRAGDFMHEGWHGWASKYGYTFGSCGGHRSGPQGACTRECGCDYFYFHGISEYAFGAMYETDGTANRFHSPNQVQVEFLCDVVDQSQPWVPASVREAARVDADARASERFINGPGYTCGTPRPW